MSRTYRSRRYRQMWHSDNPLMDWYASEDEIKWEDVDYAKYSWDYSFMKVPRYSIKYKANSKTGRKLMAVAKSDAATSSCKEPGPSIFRKLYVMRPLRRQAKNEILKFIKSVPNLKNYGTVDDWYCYNDIYEPMILTDPPLPYWT